MKGLNFWKRKRKGKNKVEEEFDILVVPGTWSGYSDDDRDPEESDPNMRKIGGDFVIPSE